MADRWSIAEARKHFAELIESAVKEPQAVYRRDRLVALVVDPEMLKEFVAWKEERAGRSIADAFDELRQLCREEGYRLRVPVRKNRPNPFAEES